jgi:hypothetical protein
MPAVKKGEKRSDYVGRAVPQLMKEGLTQKQAVGKAEGMYTGKWGQKKKGK